ncbi:BHMT2 [Branchiostoma lanceolatum]|uniref:BHMT2 protein n=1 Tax=Branchiostoma lanceolatum TaxID=7740 RepID=A0A8K0A687_BRALA|nr:BHMT2 [Branchiostoma lanceolatum]
MRHRQPGNVTISHPNICLEMTPACLYFPGLLARLQAGETVICAEGYLFEFERRGYLKAGGFVPEVVIEHPELVEGLHREFVHAGSDVVLAFTYYAHREKMRIIGREADLERINRTALRLARKVADDTGTLMAGNICNLNIYDPVKPDWEERAHDMFKEQLEWIMEEGGCDFIVAETFFAYAEAKLALECVRKYAKGKVAFPLDLDPWLCSRSQIAAFSRRAHDIGVRYIGLCCGNASHFTRAMAEALGHQPPASRYTADMSKHAYYGTDPTLVNFNTEEVCKNKF